MLAIRIYLLIGCFILINLFVLLYQGSGYNNYNRHPQKDEIKASLFQFDQEPNKSSKIWEIFDASDCVGQPFQVYVHDLSSSLKDSKAAQSLQFNLLNSPYSTRDLKQACLFIYLSHENEDLERVPFWTRSGEGLLVIFLEGNIPSTTKYTKRRAFFVGQSSKPSNHETYDLQVYTNVPNATNEAYRLLPKIYPFQKKQYLMNLMTSNPENSIQNYFSASLSKLYYVDFKCKSSSAEMGMCSDEEYRVKYMKDSIFTLLLPSMEDFAQRFYEALLYGSIPVIIGDLQGCVPFAEFVDWKKAILNFPAHYLGHLQYILPQIEVERILELRRNGRFYLEHYLYDAKVIVRSILSFYRHRLGLVAPEEHGFKANVIFSTHPDSYNPQSTPSPSKMTFDLNEDIDYLWNKNPVYLDSRPLVPLKLDVPLISDMDLQISNLQTLNKDKGSFHKNLSGNYPDEKFTVVMIAYKRDEQVKYTLNMLNNVRWLDRVIVVWNDINRQVPSDIIPFIHVPIFVVNTGRNSLNNRFLPLELIRTEAIFNMDDDFNTDQATIEFSFRVWRENRLSIVGPNFRLGYMSKDGKGVYEASSYCQQNIILTSGAFLHRIYHYAYTHMLNSEIHSHIDTLFNCEDIAVNFLVSHLTRKPPIKTTPILNTRGVKSGGGLSNRGNSHYTDRSKCIAKFVEIFGYNPLVMSEYRVDSMLYGHGNQCYKTTK